MRNLLILLLLFPVVVAAQNSSGGILANSRAADWTKSGLPPTLPDGETTANPWTPPVRTQCGTTLPSTTSYATINSTMAGCAAGTYVLLGPGTFSTSPAAINLSKSGVTLRGSGADQTKMLCGTSCNFSWQGSIGQPSGFTWSAGFAAGTTVITLSGTPAVGELLVLEGDGGNTDTGSVWICADNGVCNGGTNGPATQYEVHRVTAATGGSVTISPPVSFTAFASLANLRAARTTTPATGVGLEDLTVDCTSSNANCLFMGYTYGSWMKGVRIINGVPPMLGITNSGNCLLANNYFAQGQTSIVEPTNPNTTGFNLYLNNIFSGGGSFVQGPGSTDVWAYNLGRDVIDNAGQYFVNNTISNHTPAYSMNLAEGNEMANWQEDNVHGTANLNTFFRNIFYGTDPPFNAASHHGWSLQLAGVSRMENVIGNVMGNAVNQTTYKCIDPPFGDNCVVPLSGSATNINDPLTSTSVMLWGNFDIITNAVRWCGNSSNTGWTTTCASTSEVPTAMSGAAATYDNPVPSTQTLPASFFLGVTAHPTGGTGLSWWKVCTNYPTCTTSTTPPFPPAGPDVTGGNINGTGGFPNYLGFANHIPAYVAWKNLPVDTSYRQTFAITGSSFASGTVTLTITGFSSSFTPNGEFTLTGTGCNGTYMMTNSTPTTVSFALASNTCGTTGSLLWPNIRQFNETVYQADPNVTPILSPNNSQTGNSADSLQPPTLTFGNQGTNTSSMAIPISINNCSTITIPACTGTGTLTLAATPLAITGPNASDFTFALGTCSANQVIASGGTCSPTITFKPTQTAGTAETATLTVSYQNGTPASTMSLTGTSATVTALPACGSTLTGTTIYQATANVTCNGIAYSFTGCPVVNLDGFTVTWNNTAQTTPTGAFLTGGFNECITVYNGVISQGAGTNSQSTTYTNNFLAAIGPGAGNLNFVDNNAFFNLTFNQSFQYWAAINTLGPGTTGGNLVAHDITINNTAVGNCGNPGCRSFLQSTLIKQPAANNQPTTPTHIYNVTVNGSAQGGIMAQAPGSIIENNLVNIGSVTGTNSNNFGIYNWGPGTARNNIINTPLGNNNGRGLAMQGDGPAGSKFASGNYIQAFELPNSTEYASNAGCEIGGVYGIQFDDNPQGPSINVSGNTVNVFVNKCGGTGLRLTDTELTTNTSTNNIYTVSRQTGALDCTINTEADPNFGCAFGISISGNYNSTNPPASPLSAFTSTGDTFVADSGFILIGESGAFNSALKFFSPTFNKGLNPSPTFHTFWAANGVAGTVWVIDPTAGTGVSLTDTRFLAQSSVQAPVSLYVQWTQTITAQNASAAPISGATVTYTGALETDSCTTNSSGVCKVIVTQNRLNNDTAANQIEVRNPYTRTVAATGFTTNTVTGITLTSPNSVTVTLSSGSSPAAAPTFSPVAGTYVGPTLVTMSSTTGGATITSCFDTTNTCTPSTAGATFTASSNGFLRAFANASGFTQSSTSSAKYTIQATPPVFTPGPGSYVGPTSVSLSSTTGTVICYTINATIPVTNGAGTGCTTGTQFTAAIPLTLSTTIQAVAGQSGVADSPVAIGNFGIEGAAAPSIFARGGMIIMNGGFQ